MRALPLPYVLQSPEWDRHQCGAATAIRPLGPGLGLSIRTVQDLEGLSDTIFIHQIHHIRGPTALSPDDIDAIVAAGGWAFVYQYNRT